MKVGTRGQARGSRRSRGGFPCSTYGLDGDGQGIQVHVDGVDARQVLQDHGIAGHFPIRSQHYPSAPAAGYRGAGREPRNLCPRGCWRPCRPWRRDSGAGRRRSWSGVRWPRGGGRGCPARRRPDPRGPGFRRRCGLPPPSSRGFRADGGQARGKGDVLRGEIAGTHRHRMQGGEGRSVPDARRFRGCRSRPRSPSRRPGRRHPSPRRIPAGRLRRAGGRHPREIAGRPRRRAPPGTRFWESTPGRRLPAGSPRAA